MALPGLLLTLYFVQPDFSAAAILIPPWLWLIPGCAALFVCRRGMTRRQVAVTALMWLLFVVWFVDESRSLARSLFTSPPAADAADYGGHPEGVGRLRIVTLNAAGVAAAVRETARYDADVVLIQEAPSVPQLRLLLPEVMGKDAELIHAGDLAILAQDALEERFGDEAQTYLGATFRHSEVVPLKLVCLRFTPPVARLDAWTAGFWQDHSKLRETHGSELTQLLADPQVRLSPGRTVLGGDFNMPPHDKVLRRLRPQFTDSFLVAGRGWGHTGTNQFPLFRVDQIHVGHDCVPISVTAVRTANSDHRMVVCDVLVPRPSIAEPADLVDTGSQEAVLRD